jgi:hypothetical protein
VLALPDLAHAVLGISGPKAAIFGRAPALPKKQRAGTS